MSSFLWLEDRPQISKPVIPENTEIQISSRINKGPTKSQSSDNNVIILTYEDARQRCPQRCYMFRSMLQCVLAMATSSWLLRVNSKWIEYIGVQIMYDRMSISKGWPSITLVHHVPLAWFTLHQTNQTFLRSTAVAISFITPPTI